MKPPPAYYTQPWVGEPYSVTPHPQIAVCILAAGHGTRMHSDLPKCMHPLAGRPMLLYMVELATLLKPAHISLVLQPDHAPLTQAALDASSNSLAPVHVVLQSTPRGTGDAVRIAYPSLPDTAAYVVVLYGDSPLVTPHSVAAMAQALAQAPRTLAMVMLGFETRTPDGYGRLLLAEADETDTASHTPLPASWPISLHPLEAIIEHHEATAAQRAITLCNSGMMVIRRSALKEILGHLTHHNRANEYYLTDAVRLAASLGYQSAVYRSPLPDEGYGINSRSELAYAERCMQQRLRHSIMHRGCSLVDPDSVFLSYDTAISPDVTIHPHVVIGPGVSIGARTHIHAHSHITDTVIGQHSSVGPFARLRAHTVLEDGVKVGNFAEIKNTRCANHAKIPHFSYTGDAYIGPHANIAAGVVTCNYDGVRKHHTHIGARVLVGANSALVAPLSIGDGAVIGAGSVVTQPVPSEAICVARARQRLLNESAPERTERLKRTEPARGHPSPHATVETSSDTHRDEPQGEPSMEGF